MCFTRKNIQPKYVYVLDFNQHWVLHFSSEFITERALNVWICQHKQILKNKILHDCEGTVNTPLLVTLNANNLGWQGPSHLEGDKIKLTLHFVPVHQTQMFGAQCFLFWTCNTLIQYTLVNSNATHIYTETAV